MSARGMKNADGYIFEAGSVVGGVVWRSEEFCYLLVGFGLKMLFER